MRLVGLFFSAKKGYFRKNLIIPYQNLIPRIFEENRNNVE